MSFFIKIKKVSLIPLVLILGGITNNCFAQSKAETINAAYFFTFGRYASAGEIKYWSAGNNSFAQLVVNNRTYLTTNASERQQTIQRAFMDSFGWGPSGQEVNYFTSQAKCYADIVAYNMNTTLRPAPDKRATVIKQSYYKVFNRLPNTGELNYWMSQPLYSFVQLVAFHSSWKARNSQSSTVTAIQPNLNTNGISTAALSPTTVSLMIAGGGSSIVSQGAGNVVAAGAGNVVAQGAGN